ncbi:MAG: 16S rRNA (guanine(527)-N(7))-methyltransferase RsmG [Saprospiraceae bacterium]
MEILTKYFPGLSEKQLQQFEALGPLYTDWNAKVNLISRKDIGNLYLHHVLHSLAIAKVIDFKAGAEVLDIGTGGGFPGVPLAILFPETKFHLIDGTLKKIRVVQDVIERLELGNASAAQVRAEELKGRKFDFVVSRAVAELPKLFEWSRRLFKEDQKHFIPNGLLALKGGNVAKEVKALPKGEYAETHPISDFFKEPFFEEKYVVYVQA